MYKKVKCNDYFEADKIARKESDAGYIDLEVELDSDDLEFLKEGGILLYVGEYGTTIELKGENQ